LHEFPDDQDWQKERDVRVRCALDLKAGLFEHMSEFGQTIAPAMMTHIILQAPQKHERRHKQQHPPAGP